MHGDAALCETHIKPRLHPPGAVNNHAFVSCQSVQLRIEITDGASNLDLRSPLSAGAYGDTIRIFLEPR